MSAIKFDFCGGVLVESICETKPIVNDSGVKRGIITKFSAKSGSNMGYYLRGCVADYRYMLTLTYPAEDSQAILCKQHLKAMLLRLQRNIEGRKDAEFRDGFLHSGSKVFSCFWFIEFTRRGTPHFHIFTTHKFNHQSVATWWADIVKSEHKSHLCAGTRFERLRSGRGGTVAYAKKYANKQYQKELPDMWKDSGIGRFWGITGCREVVSAATQLQTGGVHGKCHNIIAKSFVNCLESILRGGKLRKIETPMCRIWITDDEHTRKQIFELISECNELKKHDSKMLQQTKTKYFANIYRERRGQDNLLRY